MKDNLPSQKYYTQLRQLLSAMVPPLFAWKCNSLPS